MQQYMWAGLRQQIEVWTLGHGLQYAGEHPVATVVVSTASAAATWGPHGLGYDFRANDLYNQACDDYKYLYVQNGDPTLQQKWGTALNGVYSPVTGKRRLQENVEREAKERFKRNVNNQQAERERLEKNRRE